MFAGKQIKATI